MEQDIPSQIRAKLKDLCTGPDSYPDFWYWHDYMGEWQLSLRDAKEDIDCIGCVDIIPLENGHLCRYKILPEDHNEWLLKIEIFDPPGYPRIPVIKIPVKGSLQEAKRKVDLLLGSDTPPLPSTG
jgi:hypothetical protein